MMTGPANGEPAQRPSDLERVAALMRKHCDGFLGAVADLLADVADDHRHSLCDECRGGYACPRTIYAERVAFAWLLGQLGG
jgi:hypothetical protein